MTRTTNARVAGATFLVYIAAGVTTMSGAAHGILHTGLSFAECFSALVLAVTLYAITRDVDPDLALLGMTCRVGEGILGAAGMAIGTGKMQVGATFFAAGSTLFCWLLLRGRIIPAPLAWIGLLASLLLVVALPVQLAGELPRSLAMTIWLPMLAFEVPLALWFLIKGIRSPEDRLRRHG